MQNQKERALYVDYRRGKVLAPSQIGQQAARSQIRAVRRAVAQAEKFDVSETIAAWALVSGAVRALMDSQWDAFMAAFHVAQRDGDFGPLAAMVTKRPEWRAAVLELRVKSSPAAKPDG
jgi:hypothetical protein